MTSPFDHVPLAPRDPIIGVTEAFQADGRPDKVNLGVGVYYDNDGRVPLLDCVAEVERRLRRMLSRTIRDSMAGAAPPPEGFTVQDIEGALRDLDDGTGTIALRELDEVLQRVLRDLGAPAPQGGGEREGRRGR